MPTLRGELAQLYLPSAARNWPNKKGVALYPHTPCADVRAVGGSWQYGWSAQPATCQGIENVPMISCATDAPALIDGPAPIGGNSNWLMLFNEPDLILPITPSQAAILYHRLLPIIADRKVVAPAPSELHINWLPEFRQAHIDTYTEPPRLDALAAHCYKQSAAQCQALVEQFITWADQWGVPEVWVTEFSFTDPAQAHTFITWMNANPRVTRYAWFANRLPATHVSDAPLLDWDTGHLTPWGTMYNDAH